MLFRLLLWVDKIVSIPHITVSVFTHVALRVCVCVCMYISHRVPISRMLYWPAHPWVGVPMGGSLVAGVSSGC
jgi:hypothetical protein